MWVEGLRASEFKAFRASKDGVHCNSGSWGGYGIVGPCGLGIFGGLCGLKV